MTDDTLRTDSGTTTFMVRLCWNVEQMTTKDAGLYVVLLLAAGFYPVSTELGLVTPTKIGTAIVETAPFAPPGPSGLTLEEWQAAVEALLRGIGNSMLYAVLATTILAFVGGITAYGLTIPDWKQSCKVLALALIIAGTFISYQVVLVPLTQFWSQWAQLTDLLSFVWALGIPNGYVGIVELVVTHVAYGIPTCTLLFRTYYKTMSEEMIESTHLDEATLRWVYWRIVFPLSGPMFAVVLIYQFTQIWNDLSFTLALTSTGSSSATPVVLILVEPGTSLEGQDFALRMTGAFFVAFPALAVYIFFGDESAEGVAA